MKSSLRRTAAVVLAVALSVPFTAVAAPSTRDLDTRDRIVRVIRHLQKIFRISVMDDLPTPPHPTPPPPPPTTTT
ncbi:MAG TPA: hypothetical protein VF432_25390 [Thermoanaerobaculia bacterium]